MKMEKVKQNKMKHSVIKRAFVLTTVGLLITGMVCAQTHEISFWGSGGVSSLQSRPSSGKMTAGFASALGVGYTFFLNNHWGLSSGLEYAIYQNKTGIEGFTEACETVDIFNNPILYHARINSYSEKLFAATVNLPLSVLYQTDGDIRFYVSAGLKPGLPVSAKYEGSNCMLETSGYYTEYDQTEIWQNDLGYGVFSRSGKKGKMDLKSAVMGTLETGVKWETDMGHSFYAGVFLDYGINNALKNDCSQKPMVEYNRNEPNEPVMNPAFIPASRISPMALGVKLKMAFVIGY